MNKRLGAVSVGAMVLCGGIVAQATAGTCPPGVDAVMALVASDFTEGRCIEAGDQLKVELFMSCLAEPAAGFQAFISFDDALLEFVSGSYASPAPFGLPVIDPITASNGEIDLSAGIDVFNGQMPSQADALLATLFFSPIADGSTNVVFRANSPPTRLAGVTQSLIPLEQDTSIIHTRIMCPFIGDLNCDGFVTVSDIGPFVLALTNPAGYMSTFPACDILAGDVNGDGFVTVSDIGPFVVLLTGG